jgi:GNAT superfamily N-acetyltransferase
VIRDATPEDIADIAELIRELADYERLAHEVRWNEAELHTAIFGADAVPRVLIAETSTGAVAGMALYFATFSTFIGAPGIWLEDLFVREEHRGQGYGKALLEELRRRTAHRVEWSVLDWNEPAQGFYRRLGATPMEEWTTWRWLPGDREPREREPRNETPRDRTQRDRGRSDSR